MTPEAKITRKKKVVFGRVSRKKKKKVLGIGGTGEKEERSENALVFWGEISTLVQSGGKVNSAGVEMVP